VVRGGIVKHIVCGLPGAHISGSSGNMTMTMTFI
jgi:hypothetical protein